MDNDRVPPLRLAAPSLRSIVRLIAIVVGSALVLYLAWRVRDVVRLVVIALFLALSLLPLVDRLDGRTRLPRAATILGLYLTLAAAVLLVGAVVVPGMAEQVALVAHDAPHDVHALRRNATFRRYDDRYGLTTHLEADARALPRRVTRATGSLGSVTVKAFGAIGRLVTVLSIAFLLLLHGRDYVGMALRLTGRREARYRRLVADISRAVAQYMLGNLAISAVAAAGTWLVLTLLGVPYALPLGVVVGFFDLIPLVGATLGAIIVAVATMTVDFPVATTAWIAYVIVYQRFENYLLQPLVYGRTLDVNPLVTILAVLVGSSLLGILGALLAIPVAAAIQIILRDWWAERTGAPVRAPRRRC